MLVPPFLEAIISPFHACKGDFQCYLQFPQAFSSQEVQASNLSLPKRGKKKILSFNLRERRAGEGTKKWGSKERKGWTRRCGGKLACREIRWNRQLPRQGYEEEDKGLKAETEGVWGSKALSRSLLGSLILGSLILEELHSTHTGVTSPGSFPALTGHKPCGHCCL